MSLRETAQEKLHAPLACGRVHVHQIGPVLGARVEQEAGTRFHREIEAQIVGLQEQRTLTIATKAEVNEEIAATQEMIEENQERLEELRD